MTEQTSHDAVRQVYMVLSPRSLPYARLGIESLLRNSSERLHVHLITDNAEDKSVLTDLMEAVAQVSSHAWDVTAEQELLDREATVFADYPQVRTFRHGHPCWRKVTDPLLLNKAGEELVLLDPDVLFPNRFRFEPTPATGLLLMWQRPNCLLPEEIVQRAMDADVALARHVDIGVSQWRGSLDLDWLEWLLTVLGRDGLPRAMHVEAIVWAAIAMQEGGGYLDPRHWVCWHRTQRNRVMRKLGRPGADVLQSEPWSTMRCFHAGGEAKWWLADLPRRDAGDATMDAAPSRVLPFVPLTPARYGREQAAKRMLSRLGYYRLLGTS